MDFTRYCIQIFKYIHRIPSPNETKRTLSNKNSLLFVLKVESVFHFLFPKLQGEDSMDHMISPFLTEACPPTPGIVPRRRGLVLRRGICRSWVWGIDFLFPLQKNDSTYPTKNGGKAGKMMFKHTNLGVSFPFPGGFFLIN